MKPVAVFKKDLTDASAVAFPFRYRNREWQGLLICHQGRYYSYLNECRHVPIPLDLSSGDYFSVDKTQLQCHSHGALFDIPTGYCVDGPCQGKSLFPLEVVEHDVSVEVFIPKDFHEERKG